MLNKNPSKLALGVSLFIIGMILLSKSQEMKVKTSKTFANEPISVEGFLKDDLQSAPTPKRIIIPDLGIDLEVEKSEIVGGYWHVYDDKAGWGEGSGYPGLPGNQVIFAHAREGLFLSLQSIEVDTIIYILTNSGWFDYKVAEIKEVNPTQTEVIAPTNDEILTLYTCSGYKDEKRLIITAKPI